MAAGRTSAAVVALALLATACSSDDEAEPGQDSLRIENQGGSLEGHTPRGFPGMGTGLFSGDDLNPNFPSGDGVQIFLSFPIPPDQQAPTSAILTSEALHLSGSPFDDLGSLRVASVGYETFGPHLFDLATDSEPALCSRISEQSITCDVTSAFAADVAAGAGYSQFRLRFDIAGDSDDRQDLAMFFERDSNTNEPGLFILDLGPAATGG
jgi:hypothetical protein